MRETKTAVTIAGVGELERQAKAGRFAAGQALIAGLDEFDFAQASCIGDGGSAQPRKADARNDVRVSNTTSYRTDDLVSEREDGAGGAALNEQSGYNGVRYKCK